MEGIHPKLFQDLFGYSAISMTLDICSHILPGMQQDTIYHLMQADSSALVVLKSVELFHRFDEANMLPQLGGKNVHTMVSSQEKISFDHNRSKGRWNHDPF